MGDPLRMRELGLGAGALVEVAHRAGFGGRVVTVGPTRIALDHVTCTRLDVVLVASPTHAAGASTGAGAGPVAP
ncbi:FeoA-like protein [Sanguibacter antarcticus]|uniref:FeoA-like protein n=1 Tax=Sanguibacter antarcticus TaxID=372484 RepID=A0A2A9E3H4_9MICO|nr:FeoA-like protein [Sanguibacter antarcticus]